MSFDVSRVEVIYAEDEDTFRMITLPVLQWTGFAKENIYEAQNGQEAIDHLMRLQGDDDRPLLALLDVRMPVMTGDQCAAEIQKLVDEKKISRCPFVAICTAGADKVTVDENSAVKISLPKPLGKQQLETVLEAAKSWWARTMPKQPKAPFDPSAVNVLVANDEPICSMALVASFSVASVSDDRMVQVETPEEMVEEIRRMGAKSAPLLVCIGAADWLPQAVEASQGLAEKPFLVSSGLEVDIAGFNAKLSPSGDQEHVRDVLKQCYDWWVSQ